MHKMVLVAVQQVLMERFAYYVVVVKYKLCLTLVLKVFVLVFALTIVAVSQLKDLVKYHVVSIYLDLIFVLMVATHLHAVRISHT